MPSHSSASTVSLSVAESSHPRPHRCQGFSRPPGTTTRSRLLFPPTTSVYKSVMVSSERTSEHPPPALFRVAVVVPSFNEASCIEGCLDAVHASATTLEALRLGVSVRVVVSRSTPNRPTRTYRATNPEPSNQVSDGGSTDCTETLATAHRVGVVLAGRAPGDARGRGPQLNHGASVALRGEGKGVDHRSPTLHPAPCTTLRIFGHPLPPSPNCPPMSLTPTTRTGHPRPDEN